MTGAGGPIAQRWLRLLLLLGALAGGAAGQYWLTFDRRPEQAALAWAIAALSFIGLYLLSRDSRQLPSPDAVELPRNWEYGLLASVLGIGVFFTWYRFAEFPPGLNHDAAWEGMYAIRILKGLVPFQAYANEAWGRETFTFYLRAASIWLMGPTPLAVTVPSMVAGVLILPFFYWWARLMFGSRLALLGTLFLGVSGWHLIFSRTGWRSDFQPLFTVLTCCFFIRAMVTAAKLDFALAGVNLALTLNTYNAARVFPLFIPMWLLASVPQSWHWRGFLRRYGVGFVVMAVAFCIVIAPMAWYAFNYWVQFTGRAAYLAEGVSVLSNLKETLLLFNYRGNGDDFFTHGAGLEYLPAVFLVFGFLWVLANLWDERAQFLLLGLVISLLPGMLSKPNMNRNIGAMPFIYFLVGLGVLFFALQLRRLIPRIGFVVAAIFVVAVGAGAMSDTFTQYLGPHPREIWGYYPETTVLGKYVNTLVPNYKIWVGDTSYFPRDTITYLSYQGEGNPERRNYTWVDDATMLLRERLTAPAGKGLAFVLESSGRGRQVLAELERRYPKHRTTELRYPADNGRVFAKAVLVPADGIALAADPGDADLLPEPTPEPGQEPAPVAVEPQHVPDATGVLQQPRGVAVASDGHIVVCDFGNNRLQEFGSDLKFLREWGGSGAGHGQFNQPGALAIGPNGEIFVADTWNQRIQVFSTTHQYLREWTYSFFAPRGIAVDAQGGVFVADSGNNRIVRFNATGQKEVEWGGKGSRDEQFTEPVGIAIDTAGQVYACDNGNAQLKVFTRDGKFVKGFSVRGWGLKPYSEPHVTLAASTIWVTVPTEKEIRNYDSTGKLLRTITGTSIPGVTFEMPMGIAYSAGENELIVTDLNNRLVRIPLAH